MTTENRSIRGLVTAMLVALALCVGARAQDEEGLPKGIKLQGKVGPRLMSPVEPIPEPREVDLSRLDVDEEVALTFTEKLSRPLDVDELEDLRQRKMERMQRRLGTTMSQAALIRDEFFDVEQEKARKKAPKTEPEEESSPWLAVIVGVLLAGIVFHEFRK